MCLEKKKLCGCKRKREACLCVKSIIRVMCDKHQGLYIYLGYVVVFKLMNFGPVIGLCLFLHLG